MANPSVVVGSINDKEIKATIDSLVKHVDEATEKMAKKFDGTLSSMQASLKSFGNLAKGLSSSMGSVSAGVSQASQTATNTATSFQSLANAMKDASNAGKSSSGWKVVEQYDEQLSKLKQRLVQVRSDIDLYNQAIGSGKPSLVPWGQEGLKQANQEAERLMATIKKLESQRGNLVDAIKPNHSWENYMNSLSKVNPELAALNAQYRQGITLMGNQLVLSKQQSEELRKQVEEGQKVALTYKGISFTTDEMQRLGSTIGMSTKELSAFISSGQLSKSSLMDLKSALSATGHQFDEEYAKVRSLIGALQIYNGQIKDKGTIGAIIRADARDSSFNIPLERIELYAKALGKTREEMQQYIKTLEAEYRASSQASTSRSKSFQDFTRLQQAVDFVNQGLKKTTTITLSQASSYDKLNNTLKYLQTAYHRLNQEERNSDMGQRLARSIQVVSRNLQVLQSQMNRPTDFRSVMGLDASTLENIAYKIRQLSSYRSGLNVDTQAREIKTVTQEIERLQKKQNDLIGTNNNLLQSNNALARSWNYMKNRLAFYFTVGASTQFVKNLIDVRGQYELLERSIGILIDSAQNGSKIFAELNAMAIKSPFTTLELGAAAKQLVAYDVAAKDVVETTKRLADMAAAVGVPIERLTYALGQIKAYGYLNARDARMFSNTGIPLVKELADYYTQLEGQLVSVSDVYDRIKKKAIGYEEVMAVVNKMTDEGGKFFNFQEKAADTLKVKLANLTLAWNNMLNEIGKDSQGKLSNSLVLLKGIFESWRGIENTLYAALATFLKFRFAMFLYYAILEKAGVSLAFQFAIGQKLTNLFTSLGSVLTKVFSSPMTMAAAAFTVASLYATKLYMDYLDLQKANEDFNRSIANNAQENIDSIEKFFGEYKNQLDAIGSASQTDQQKMWERLQEEIENTSKNARQFLEVLKDIGDISTKIKLGETILLQEQEIQKEAKKLADKDLFSVGGGFGNDEMAKDLQNYNKLLNETIKKYGSLKEAQEKSYNVSADYMSGKIVETGDYAKLKHSMEESRAELEKFVLVLDKANIERIMGDDPDLQLSNLREFGNIIKENFLATEQGQKISTDGQALLNSYIDQWVAKQAQANGVIVNMEIAGKEYTASEIAGIEARRTAWEDFFSQLNKSDKERLDYLIETNQTGSEEFRELWDKAANNMAESATTSYNLIQQQIANLRNTPDIVINVVYRQTTEVETDKQRQSFTDKYITPKGVGMLTADEYFKQKEQNTRKYGRYIKKEGEDNVEWEKRLGQTYQDNVKSIASLNNQLKHSANLSKEDRDAKQDELETLKGQNQVLKELEKSQGFDYAQFEKGKGKGKHTKKGTKPEDLVAKALKDELSIIKEMQSNYDKLRKAGVSNTDAINMATKGYEGTLLRVNAVLSKYGINKFNASDFAGKNVKQLLDRLEKQRDALIASGKVKTSSLKDLDVEIQKLTIDAKAYDLKKITDGLNNELSKIKDEYEIAMELDANPELGQILANAFDLDVSKYPKTVQDAINRMQEVTDRRIGDYFFGEGSDIDENDIMHTFDILRGDLEKWSKETGVEIGSNIYNAIKEAQTKSRDLFKKDASDTIADWEKLIQKYAEYEYRRNEIIKQAEKERATARKHGASKEILDAIDEKERRNLAKLDFEQFQKSPQWIVAAGDLAGMTEEALYGLIKALEEYRKKAKNLDPKEIKQINNALKNLRKQVRSNNPFHFIADAMEEARDRASLYDDELDRIQAEIQKITTAAFENGEITEEQSEKIKTLAELWEKVKEEQIEAGKVSATTMVDSITQSVNAVKGAITMFGELAQAMGGKNMTEAAETITKIADVVEKAAAGASIGAQAGGGWGALIGGVVGALAGVIINWADTWSGNKAITEQIQDINYAIRELEISYKRLQNAVEDAYGEAEIGAKQAAISNKRLQLANLESQLALEKSRKEKNKDKDAILDLEGKIADLKREIVEDIREITESLLGISSVGEAAESMISSMIDAFRNGEDYMKVFSDSFEDMIDTMVMKAIVGRVIGDRIQKMFDYIDTMQHSGMSNEAYLAEQERLRKEIDAREQALHHILSSKDSMPSYIDFDALFGQTVNELQSQLQVLYAQMAELQAKQSDVLTPENVEAMRSMYQGWQDDVKNEFDMYMEMFGIRFGDRNTEKSLSALQQGIQGITEDTAGAIEAYMNSISQQVYLHSDLLTQIRDAVVELDGSIQVSVQAQMLLQLQQSYQVQTAIQTILLGWSNASGLAVKVEMV